MLVGWVLLFSWAASVLFRRLQEMGEKRPSTSVHMRYAENLPFPAITVCNMATQVPLETMWCGSYVSNETSRCVAVIPPGMPHCLTFNNHLNGSVYTTEKTGLADTLMISLRIKRKEYPPSSRFVGVHVSLHPQCHHGKDCPEELSNVLMASPGQPKFFRMRRLTLQYLNGTSETQFEARDTISSVGDFEKSFGDREDTVVMGFHFSSLAETLITELPSYTLMDLGAELGGIMGLIFGTGAFDVLLHVIRWCAGRGSFYHDLTSRHPSEYRAGKGEGEAEEGEEPAAEVPVGGAGRSPACRLWSRRGSSVPRGCGWLDQALGACCPRQFYASRAVAAEEDSAERLFVTSGRAAPWGAERGGGMPVVVRGRSADVLTMGPGAERAGWWALLCCCAVMTVREVDAGGSAEGRGGASAAGEPAGVEGGVFGGSNGASDAVALAGREEDEEEDRFDGEGRGVRRPLLAARSASSGAQGD